MPTRFTYRNYFSGNCFGDVLIINSYASLHLVPVCVFNYIKIERWMGGRERARYECLTKLTKLSTSIFANTNKCTGKKQTTARPAVGDKLKRKTNDHIFHYPLNPNSMANDFRRRSHEIISMFLDHTSRWLLSHPSHLAEWVAGKMPRLCVCVWVSASVMSSRIKH